MTYRVICPVNNNKIIVNLPSDFKDKKQVTILVDDHIDSKEQKLQLLKNAASDPLFLTDIKDVQNDFDNIDHETL